MSDTNSEQMSPSPSDMSPIRASLHDASKRRSLFSHPSSTTQRMKREEESVQLVELPMPHVSDDDIPVPVTHPKEGVTVRVSEAMSESSVQTVRTEATLADESPLVTTKPSPSRVTTSAQKTPTMSTIKNVVQKAAQEVEKKTNGGGGTRSSVTRTHVPLSPATLQKLSQQAPHRVVIHSAFQKDRDAEIIDDKGTRHKMGSKSRVLYIPTKEERDELPAKEGTEKRVVTEYVFAAHEPRMFEQAPRGVHFAAHKVDTASPIAGVFNKQQRRMESSVGMTEPEPLSATSFTGATTTTQHRAGAKPAESFISAAEIENEILNIKHHNEKLQDQIHNYGRNPTNNKLKNLNRRVERALKHVDPSKLALSMTYRECVERLLQLCEYAERVDENTSNAILEGVSTEKTPLIEGKTAIPHNSERRKQLDELAKNKENLRKILHNQPTTIEAGDRSIEITDTGHYHYRAAILRKDLSMKRKQLRERITFLLLVGGVLLVAMVVFLIILTIVLVKTAQEE